MNKLSKGKALEPSQKVKVQFRCELMYILFVKEVLFFKRHNEFEKLRDKLKGEVEKR